MGIVSVTSWGSQTGKIGILISNARDRGVREGGGGAKEKVRAFTKMQLSVILFYLKGWCPEAAMEEAFQGKVSGALAALRQCQTAAEGTLNTQQDTLRHVCDLGVQRLTFGMLSLLQFAKPIPVP